MTAVYPNTTNLPSDYLNVLSSQANQSRLKTAATKVSTQTHTQQEEEQVFLNP